VDDMTVPSDLTLPEGATDEYRRQVERANEYFRWARRHMKKMTDEVKRLGNFRGTVPIHNGPNGIIIGVA